MSRSYKKVPFVKCERTCKWGKRYANKRVRKTLDIPSGKWYKKIYCSWNICDYSHISTRAEIIARWEAAQKDKLYGVNNYTNWYTNETLEEALIDWKLSYKCK